MSWLIPNPREVIPALRRAAGLRSRTQYFREYYARNRSTLRPYRTEWMRKARAIDAVRVSLNGQRGRPRIPEITQRRIAVLAGKMPVPELAEYLGLHRSTVKKYLAQHWARDFTTI